MGKFEDLKSLDNLRARGCISEEEYQSTKNRILTAPDRPWGMSENIYIMLMHVSQYAGFLIPGLGFVMPIVMWLTNKQNPLIDEHGKNITNFMLSMIIYISISCILCLVLIGFVMLALLGLLELIFIIIAAVKAYRNEYWKYPMAIPFFS